LPTLINSKVVIGHITKMDFHTIEISETRHAFLTSDRPIMMTNGLDKPEHHIMMPISPTRLFMAVRTPEIFHRTKSIPPNELVRLSNARVTLQARKYVYGVDNSQIRFAHNRMGKMYPSSPLG
jgi:hypothetical protein